VACVLGREQARSLGLVWQTAGALTAGWFDAA
jgi:hypothetical protein